EGAAFSGPVASFVDDDPGGTATDYSATITWGDGQTSAGTIAPDPANPGQFLVSGTNTYHQAGSYTIGVAIQDIGGSATTATVPIQVADAALSVAPAAAVTATEGASFSGVVGSYTDANPFGGAGDFTATIAWGDGGTS